MKVSARRFASVFAAAALLAAGAAPARGQGGLGVVPPGCVSNLASFASTDTPRPIHDLQTTTSTISVSGLGGYLQDLDVTTDVAHTFAADLVITVTSPAGTAVTLTSDNGGGNDNVYAGTLWDDDAGDANPRGAASDNVYANGVVETPLVPEEALAAFIGEDPNGTWTITVFDNASSDHGTLNSWGLSITSLATAPIDDPPVSVTSTDTPRPIRDMQTTTSTIAVAGAGAFVCDVNVITNMPHTFAGDLEVDVVSPGGTVSTLTTDNGDGNDNVFAGTLWDDGGGSANPPGPATDNVYANMVVETPLVPEEALGAFIGEDPNGNWMLRVFDDANSDQGTLASWTVEITTCSCVQPDADLEVTNTGVYDSSSDRITWTITVTDNGPDGATGVTVTDPLDPCTTFVSDDCGGVVVPPWTWNVGALASGAGATCNVVVDASACPVGPVTNTAIASGNETDAMSDNDTATAAVGVGGVLEIPTLGRAGLLLLLLAISLGALVILRRRS